MSRGVPNKNADSLIRIGLMVSLLDSIITTGKLLLDYVLRNRG